MQYFQRHSLVIGLVLLLAGCAAPSAPASSRPAASAPAAPATPKRVAVAFAGNPPALAYRFSAGGSGGTGVANVESLVNRGLSILNGKLERVPQLAEAVP